MGNRTEIGMETGNIHATHMLSLTHLLYIIVQAQR